jgi:hypothetical protein
MRDLKTRGLNEPKLVIGDGALGTWAALTDVFPGARRQACWVHKIARVLDALPKRLQPRAKTLLHEMAEAPSRADAKAALERFRSEFDAKYPKAVAKLDRDWAALTAFYDFPAEHWRHLRTTNPIESSFATVRLRTRVTKGAGSKAAALAMAYKLLESAQQRWRRFNGHELVADVLAPCGALTLLAVFRHRQMSEQAIGGGTVPVHRIGRDHHRVAGIDRLRPRALADADAADTGEAIQCLAHRMGMPAGPRPRGKRNDRRPHARRQLSDEHLVLAMGAVTNFFRTPGLAEHALTMKTLGDAMLVRNRVIDALELADNQANEAERKKTLTVVVAGGGFAGAETVGAVNDFLREGMKFYPHLKEDMLRVVLVHPGEASGDAVVSVMMPAVKTRMLRLFSN